MIELLTSPEAWAALLTLTALEIVLGIDNVIFLSVVVSRIPQRQAKQARQIGLALALVFRILLLSLLVWLIGLTQAIFTVKGTAFSWRDIILIGGGLFLIAKATHEIHAEVEAREEEGDRASGASAFLWVIAQIIVIDMVFSLDSIITAIGMVQDLAIMIAAVVIACLIMYVSSGPVAKFVSWRWRFWCLSALPWSPTDSSFTFRAATSILRSRSRRRSSSSTCSPNATAKRRRIRHALPAELTSRPQIAFAWP